MSKKIDRNLPRASSPNDVVYIHKSYAIQGLEGRMLTLIDASIQDPVQRKAIKDLVSPMIWNWAIESDVSSYFEVKEHSVSGAVVGGHR